MTVLFFCLKTYENHWFWEVEEHHAGVLDTSGPPKLGCNMVLWVQDNSRANKAVLAQVLWHQGQQTYAGAHKKQTCFLGGGKNEILDPGADSK